MPESRPYSFALSDAIRRALLGADMPGVTLSRRAVERLTLVRTDTPRTQIPPHRGRTRRQRQDAVVDLRRRSGRHAVGSGRT
jgi:hypothetical protein